MLQERENDRESAKNAKMTNAIAQNAATRKMQKRKKQQETKVSAKCEKTNVNVKCGKRMRERKKWQEEKRESTKRGKKA